MNLGWGEGAVGEKRWREQAEVARVYRE